MKMPMPLHSYAQSSSARLINCYAEAAPPEAKSPWRIVRSHGIANFCAPPPAPGRGLFVFQEQLYAVAGTTLYAVSANATLSAIGTIAGTSRISAADNGAQCVIATDGRGYVLANGSVALIADANFVGAGMVAALDSYILANRPNTRQFAASSLANAATWPALYFAAAEGSPDPIVGLIADHREVLLAKTRTAELWHDVGGAGFPFERAPSGFLELGCAAGATLAKTDNSVFWLANDLTVRRLVGLTPLRVSQHGIERLLRSFSSLSAAFAFGYQWLGHLYYVLSVPGFGSMVYDAATQEWFERQTYNKPDWRVSGAVAAYGKVFFQNSDSGALGTASELSCTEFGALRVDDVQFQQVYAEGKRVRISHIEARYRANKTASSAPRLQLYSSADGGDSWHYSGDASIGGIGQKPRAQWFRLGAARERAFKIRCADSEMIVLEDCLIDMQVCRT